MITMPGTLRIVPGDRLEIDLAIDALAPSAPCAVTLHRADGGIDRLVATAAVETLAEVAVLRAGGLLPLMLRRH